MAAFKPHYSLCPLLGPHNLVGLSPDKEESTALITLGPNIIVKHRLADQKPLKSWSTRRSYQLTCQSIFDHNSEKYVGVLNHKHVCLWNEEESNLDSVKKHTFSSNIHQVHALPGKPSLVVYENGYCENLDVSLHRRKEGKPSLLSAGESINKSFLEYIKDQPVLVLRTSANKVCYVRLATDGTPEGNMSFSLEKEGQCKVIGMVVANDGSNVTVIAVWSDGSLVQYSEQGVVLTTQKLSGICLTSPVTMLMLDATHIAVYGADVTEEGAVLLLFDLKFGMNVAVRKLKFFCDPPHLYCLPANNVLVLCVVQNLVVVPFVLQTSLLWNLVDNTQLLETKAKPNVIAWNEDSSEISTTAVPLNFRREDVNQLAAFLLDCNASNCRLFDELLPALKEDEDINGICLLLSSVKDLPEKWLADLVNFAAEHTHGDKLLEMLLTMPYSDVVLLNHLRQKLPTKATITFLQYLSSRLEDSRLSQDAETVGIQPDISQIVDWISLVLDAHHHELLIAGNDHQVKDLIGNLEELVTKNYEFLDCLGQSEPFVSLLEQKRRPPENRRKDWYNIEVVRLL